MTIFDILGPIAQQEGDLIKIAFFVMLAIIIPTILLTFYFAWRYRSSRQDDYAPEWDHSYGIEWTVWGIPALVVLILALITWRTTHTLDPQKQLAQKPFEVEAVAMDWKWLFIYPEQGVATVNDLIVPAGRAVHVHLTSDTVMNSFFIPGVVGQIYAMSGMRTDSNFIVNKPAELKGLDTQYDGEHFSDMHFRVEVLAESDLNSKFAHLSNNTYPKLDQPSLTALEQPSVEDKPRVYLLAEPHVFDDIVSKFRGHGMQMTRR